MKALTRDTAASVMPSFMTTTRAELVECSRAKTFAAYLGDYQSICRVLGHYRIFVDTRDKTLAPQLIMNGCWESWVSVALARLIRPGSYCVDIGANYGYYSIIMGWGMSGKGGLIAVEPNPSVANLLGHTLRLNGFGGLAKVHQAAAYSVDGQKVKLEIMEESPMNCTLETRGGKTVEVQTLTVDTMVASWPRVDLLKIDAEGAEWEIWRGMRNTLEKNPDVEIIMEFNATRGYDASMFLKIIQEAGFSLRFINQDADLESVQAETILKSSHDWMLYLKRG